MFCQNCGKEIDDNAFMCPNCGKPYNCNIKQTIKCNKIVAIMLALFFGNLGFARFYLGETNKGFIILLISILISIISVIFTPIYIYIMIPVVINLIELLLIVRKDLSNNYTDNTGGCLFMLLSLFVFLIGVIILWLCILPILISLSKMV